MPVLGHLVIGPVAVEQLGFPGVLHLAALEQHGAAADGRFRREIGSRRREGGVRDLQGGLGPGIAGGNVVQVMLRSPAPVGPSRGADTGLLIEDTPRGIIDRHPIGRRVIDIHAVGAASAHGDAGVVALAAVDKEIATVHDDRSGRFLIVLRRGLQGIRRPLKGGIVDALHIPGDPGEVRHGDVGDDLVTAQGLRGTVDVHALGQGGIVSGHVRPALVRDGGVRFQEGRLLLVFPAPFGHIRPGGPAAGDRQAGRQYEDEPFHRLMQSRL